MLHRCIAIALLTGAALLGSGGVASASQTVRTVNGTVGPGFTISLKLNGKAVRSLAPGSYRFVISDKASSHNFVLEKAKGGTFEKELTTVPFTGRKTASVRLTRGEWEFYCKPHESVMHGDFTVN